MRSLLKFTAVHAELATVGIFGRPAFFGAAFDFDSLEPFLPFFSNETDFHFVTFAKVATGVHKIIISRDEDGYKVIAFKGLYDESQILAFAELSFGAL
jgi:hypothetical protein